MLKRFGFLMLFLMGSLSAYLHPCPGGWGLDAEFLYLFPTVDDTYFVSEGANGAGHPTGPRENNDFNFTPAFRVGGAYAFCDCDREFQVYYTRLGAHQQKTVTGSGLFASLNIDGVALGSFTNYSGSAASDLHLLYQRVDAVFTQQTGCLCGLDLYVEGGVEFAYMRLREHYTFHTSVELGPFLAHAHRTSRLYGVGPEAGIGFEYALCSFSAWYPGTLSLTGLTTGSLLSSYAKEDLFADNIAAGVTSDVNNHHTWRIIPALHTRVGLNYMSYFSCFAAALEVGYEFNTYSRPFSVTSAPASTISTDYRDLDLQGLYVACTVAF